MFVLATANTELYPS